MGNDVLVIAECRGNKLRQITLEALGAAAQISGVDGRIATVIIGANIQSLAQELATYGAAKTYALDRHELEHYHPEAYFSALCKVLEQENPQYILLGHTALGKDLAPLLAAHLNAGQISDVVGIEQHGEEFVFTRPLYAGKAFEQKRFTSYPGILTIRPNNIKPLELSKFNTRAEADSAIDSMPDTATEVQTIISEIPYTPSNLSSIVKEVVRKASGKVDLTEAKIVVSGGRGVKSAEGFKPLIALAEVLNGAVGASRGACDAGYCDYSLQIGQTGKVVTPEIYIACGISGAIQHLAGMSQSRVIIAINKDPEAPIFKVADYGIVGDLFEVVPLLTAEFGKLLKSG